MSDPVRTFYSVESLQRTITSIERDWGMSTEEFLATYRPTGEPPEGMPRFVAFTWASLADELVRMGPTDAVGRIGRELVVS